MLESENRMKICFFRRIHQDGVDFWRHFTGKREILRQDAAAEEGWTGDDGLLPCHRDGPGFD